MILPVLSAFLGLALGLAASRRPGALLLPRLRGLWLLLPAMALAILPLWLDRSAPQRIWTDDRRLLLAIITLRQSLLMFLIAWNLLPNPLPLPRGLRQMARRVRAGVSTRLAALSRPQSRTSKSPAARRVQASKPERPATRWWHRLPLAGLLLAIALQTAVLLENRGYMPLTPEYLQSITNPALAAGIENGALLLHQIVGPETVLPQFAMQYRLPMIERWLPNAFPYYGLADLIGAACLVLCLLTQCLGRWPGEPARRRCPASSQFTVSSGETAMSEDASIPEVTA